MKKQLFLDYDECMAHSFYADSEGHADELLDMYSEHWRGEKFELRHDGWYVTFKRAWTNDLLTFSRQLLGDENVFILTSSIGDYVRWCNIKLELGFDPNTNIFSREDLFAHSRVHPRFSDTHNVLVDNLRYNENLNGIVSKISFLNNIPETQYVKVKPFEVWTEKTEYDKEYFEDVKARIITALEH